MSARGPLEATHPRVLVVEDDEHLRLALLDVLDSEGLCPTPAATGAQARRALGLAGRAGPRREPDSARASSFDLILLDIMLPDDDGYAICRDVRALGADAPILMLTARTLEDDLVRGFEAGADDYLAKPYRLRELLARVHALLRRRVPVDLAAPLRFGPFELCRKARELRHASGEPVELTRTEFDLLAFLIERAGCAQTRRQILDGVWGPGLRVDAHTVDNFVSSLRKKLGSTDRAPFRIRAIRGVGYRFELDAPAGGPGRSGAP